MSSRSVYRPPGYDPNLPGGNLDERWDLAAGTYTRYADDGTVAETRPLTDDEVDDLADMATSSQVAAGIDALAVLLAKAIGDNDTYLRLTEPSPDALIAQVRLLTRQMTALARYLGTVIPHAGVPRNWLDDITDVTTP